MLLKEPENDRLNKADENVVAETKLGTAPASTYSKKFGAHFLIAPTSSTNQQQHKPIFRKVFPSSTTTVLVSAVRQKKVLSVSVDCNYFLFLLNVII